jgi:hypothetical protein
LVRFADDFVALFGCKEDADRVLAVLAKRVGKYGLQLLTGSPEGRLAEDGGSA